LNREIRAKPKEIQAMSPIRLFLADDHRIFLEGLVRLLQDHPAFEILGTAGNGRSALKQIRALRPDVVLIDISMPQLNGLETTRLIRQTSPNTKVVVLSMHESEEFLTRVLESGAIGYLLKDSSAEELFLAVQEAYQGNSYLSPVLSRRLIDGYLQIKDREKATNPEPQLTGREREILQLLVEGRSNQEAAKSLDLSLKTVETHRKKIMKKLNCHHFAELVKYAIRNGIIET
jgi:DNA-binding NarL/FixJ family response regulator